MSEWDMQLLVGDGRPAIRLYLLVRPRFCVAYDLEESEWDDLDDACRGREARLCPVLEIDDRAASVRASDDVDVAGGVAGNGV